jgi:hypothetical protein
MILQQEMRKLMGRYHSFVVRIWVTEHGEFRGKVEHLASHVSIAFLDFPALLQFMQQQIQPAACGNETCAEYDQRVTDGSQASCRIDQSGTNPTDE